MDYMIAVFKAPDTPQTLVNECVKNARLTGDGIKEGQECDWHHG